MTGLLQRRDAGGHYEKNILKKILINMYLGPAEDGSQNSKRGRGVGRPGVPHTRQRVSHLAYRVFPENGSLSYLCTHG